MTVSGAGRKMEEQKERGRKRVGSGGGGAGRKRKVGKEIGSGASFQSNSGKNYYLFPAHLIINTLLCMKRKTLKMDSTIHLTNSDQIFSGYE